MAENNSPFKTEEVVKTPEKEKTITVKLKLPTYFDGDSYPAGVTLKVSPKQYRALAHRLEWVDGPVKHEPPTPAEADSLIAKGEARNASNANKSPVPDGLVAAVTEGVVAGLKGAGKAAALIAFLLCLLGTAHATPPQTYGTLPFVMPVNNIAAGATTYWVPATNSAGVWSNYVNMALFDETVLTFTGQEYSGSVGFTNTFKIYGATTPAAPDTNTVLATVTLSCPNGQTNALVSTNISRNTLGSYGGIFVGAITAASGNAGTNLTMTPYVKPSRSGR